MLSRRSCSICLYTRLEKSFNYGLPSLSLRSSGQTIATFQHNISQHCWAHVACAPTLLRRVATCWVLKIELVRHHTTSTNVACKNWPFSYLSEQQAGWQNERNMGYPTILRYVALKYCDRLARALQTSQVLHIVERKSSSYLASLFRTSPPAKPFMWKWFWFA